MEIPLDINKNISFKKNDIIHQIRELVNVKHLTKGDKLPSERMMAEKFGVKRNHLREAVSRLEFYGVIKSIPQSGIFLAVGLVGFNGMVDEIISFNNRPSFNEIVETRVTLELKTVCLAAERRTEKDLLAIEEALLAFKDKIENGLDSLEEDLLFHIAIAKAAKNNAILRLMLLITPPILATYERNIVCKGDKLIYEIEKHENVYLAIKNNDVKLAEEMMKKHFEKKSW